MAKDVFHQQVKATLIKDGWLITHDPYTIRISEAVKLQIDLAAEIAIAYPKYATIGITCSGKRDRIQLSFS